MIINGERASGDQVSLGVRSETFAYGFGIFETIKFKDGKACFLREHLSRLKRAATRASLGIPFSDRELWEQSISLFEANGLVDGVFKIVVTSDGSNSAFLMFIRNVGGTHSQEPERLRISAVTKASTAFTTRHKTLNYMENLLELKAAQARGFDECVFCNERNELTECATANLFFFKEGVLKTPAQDCGLLEGVIRGRVIRIAGEMGMRVEEGAFPPEELLQADEVFISSSGKGIASVASVDYGQTFAFPQIRSKQVARLVEALEIAESDSLKYSP